MIEYRIFSKHIFIEYHFISFFFANFIFRGSTKYTKIIICRIHFQKQTLNHIIAFFKRIQKFIIYAQQSDIHSRDSNNHEYFTSEKIMIEYHNFSTHTLFEYHFKSSFDHSTKIIFVHKSNITFKISKLSKTHLSSLSSKSRIHLWFVYRRLTS